MTGVDYQREQAYSLTGVILLKFLQRLLVRYLID
jgi:hypothetical protein